MLNFFKKPFYQILVFVLLLGSMLAWYFLKRTEEKKIVQGMTTVQTLNEEDYKGTQFKRNNRPFLLKDNKPTVLHKQKQALPPEIPIQPVLQAAQTLDKQTQLDLFTSGAQELSLSSHYAPYGRLIPCKTVITIDSSQMEAPVIGLVTEPVYHEGQLIIPAGAEVHGRASSNRMQERIDAAGNWVIVWRDDTNFNGSEMVVQGIALDRAKDYANGRWSMDDGSAGLKGYLIRSHNWAEAKLYAAHFLSGFSKLYKARAYKSMLEGGNNALYFLAKNELLESGDNFLNTFTKQILDEIKEHGYYIRVPAGSQFYLYVTQALDLGTAQQGNKAVKDIWAKHERRGRDEQESV